MIIKREFKKNYECRLYCLYCDKCMIIKREIKKIYECRLYCDKCNIELIRDPIVLSSFPEQYSYTCPTCGKITLSFNSYPKFEYELEEEDMFPWSSKDLTDGG